MGQTTSVSREVQFRVVAGRWPDDDVDNPDWVYVDKTVTSWDEARDELATRFRAFQDDSCPVCVRDAAKALAELEAAEPGRPFEACVEGDDYVILSV